MRELPVDYMAMAKEDLRVQWNICRADDPERAAKFEADLGSRFPEGSRNWYLALMLEAHKAGWAE